MTVLPNQTLTRRQIANRLNRAKRKGLTAAGKQRLREAALAHMPWLKSTGPKTPAGKAKVAANGLKRQTAEQQEYNAAFAAVTSRIKSMRALRQAALASH